MDIDGFDSGSRDADQQTRMAGPAARYSARPDRSAANGNYHTAEADNAAAVARQARAERWAHAIKARTSG